MTRRFCFEINIVTFLVGFEESQIIGYPWDVDSFAYQTYERKKIQLAASSSHCIKPIQVASTASIAMSGSNLIEHRLQRQPDTPERSIDDLRVEKAAIVTLGPGSSRDVEDDWAG
jgi:hypothetical protein